MFSAPSFALPARYIGTRPRGKGQSERQSMWFNKNSVGLSDKELEDALSVLPVDSGSHSAVESENESPSSCIKFRETSVGPCVNQSSTGTQQDAIATSDKQRGTLLWYLGQCDTNSSLTTTRPIPKKKISDYFAAAPRPK